jgi:hypothetical protein
LNRLANCPAKLREAFFLSLECCIRSFASKALPPLADTLSQLLQQCFNSVDSAKYCRSDADSSRQLYNNLVFCQALILLASASDRPDSGVTGTTTELLGQIAGCIVSTGLNDSRILDVLKEQDQDLYHTARRVFWTAFVLDRFHASSRSTNAVIPLLSGTLSHEDRSALGEVGYHLACEFISFPLDYCLLMLSGIAQIVDQIVYVNRAGSEPNPALSFALSPLKPTSPASVYLTGELRVYQQVLNGTNLTSDAPPHLACQYLRIFVARLSMQDIPSPDVLRYTRELLGNLMNGAITPLHHIFAALVATSLTELSDRVETQVDAHASIKEMSDALANGQIIHRSSDGLGWETAIRDLLHQKKVPTPPFNAPEQASPALEPNMAGLQHLAAAAVGEREGTGDNRPGSSSQQKVDNDLSAAMAAANEAAKAQATAAAAQGLFPQ